MFSVIGLILEISVWPVHEAQFSQRGACYAIRCERSHIRYENGDVSRKPITTYWKVCPQNSTATNLKTGHERPVSIYFDYIKFTDFDFFANTQLKPVSVNYEKCEVRE